MFDPQIAPPTLNYEHPDEGLDLVDLFTGSKLRVRERRATHGLARWDVVGTRVMEEPGRDVVIDGFLYLFPARDREQLLTVPPSLSLNLGQHLLGWLASLPLHYTLDRANSIP